MKLKDLKKYINNLSSEFDECEVICQKDSEGNGYSPLDGVDENAIYIPDTTWSGEIMDLRWSAKDACMTEDEWDDFKNSHPKAIILYPVN